MNEQTNNTMNEELKYNINALLDYLWDAEQTHYEENPIQGHIFEVMLAIREQVNKVNGL